MEPDINTIIMLVIGLGIGLIQWLGKGKIKTIDDGIKGLAKEVKTLTESFAGYREQQLKDCSKKVQSIYNDVPKKDLVDTAIGALKDDLKDTKEDVKGLTARLNNITNGVKK